MLSTGFFLQSLSPSPSLFTLKYTSSILCLRRGQEQDEAKTKVFFDCHCSRLFFDLEERGLHLLQHTFGNASA